MNSFTTTNPISEITLNAIKSVEKQKRLLEIVYWITMLLAIFNSCAAFVLWVYNVIKHPVVVSTFFVVCGVIMTCLYVYMKANYENELRFLKRETLQ